MTGKRRTGLLSLNPFVQVFYSNAKGIEIILQNLDPGLNPFVQVFYSNLLYNQQ